MNLCTARPTAHLPGAALCALALLSLTFPAAPAAARGGTSEKLAQQLPLLKELKQSRLKGLVRAPHKDRVQQSLQHRAYLASRGVKPTRKLPRELTPEMAARLIRPGDKVFVPVGQVSSNQILKALAEQAMKPKSGYSARKPVEIVGLANTVSRKVFDRKGKVVPRSLFLSANMRDPVAASRGSFTPVFFGRIPRLIQEGKVPVDVALIQVSPPDEKGFVTLGPTVGCTLAAMKKAKKVIAQVNDQVPRTRGASRLHISELDYVVKGNEPLVPIPSANISPTDKRIAKHIVKLVLDNKPKAGRGAKVASAKAGASKRAPLCTFQFGIGGIPDAVANMLAESPALSACKVRSELIGPGTQKLVESGKVRGRVMYTFAMGDQDFLRWMNKNTKLNAQPVDLVNDPNLIGKNNRMVAINSALKVDLNGQVNAQYVRNEWYSGVGGQVDFMRGAMQSKGGKAIIAIPSTAQVSDGQGGKRLISKIVPRLDGSDVVTTSMHDVQYVVTEYGVASLEGKTAEQRARALINVAHPSFRKELRQDLTSQIKARKQAEQRRYQAFLGSQGG